MNKETIKRIKSIKAYIILMHFFKQLYPLWLCLADFWQVIQEMVCRQVLAVEI